MTTTVKRVVIGAVTAIPVLMTVMSGVMKLSGAPDLVKALNAAGMGQYITLLGLMELVFAALFVGPRTMKLGLLLLTGYFAGAIATDLSHGGPFIAPVVILSLFWIAAFLRDRSSFLPAAPEPADPTLRGHQPVAA